LAKNKCIILPKIKDDMVIKIKHSAKDVPYNCTNFVYKNKDELKYSMVKIFANCKNSTIKKIFFISLTDEEAENQTIILEQNLKKKTNKFITGKFRAEIKSLMKELIDYRYQRNSLNNEKKDINRNISGSWSSDLDNPNDNDSDKDMDEDYVLEFESEEPQINDQNKGGGENKKNRFLTLDFIDRNNQKKFTYNKSTNYKNNDEFIKSKKNFLSKKFNKIKDMSICSNKYEKNLIESLTSSFCNRIIDYVIFFVEKLKLLNVDSPDKELINFFDLTNKYYENENINNEISQIIKRT
jgi:hypothetical protein